MAMWELMKANVTLPPDASDEERQAVAEVVRDALQLAETPERLHEAVVTAAMRAKENIE